MITEAQLKTLEALKTYRYLTVRQMVRLGLYGSEKKLRERVLLPLKSPASPLIKAVDFGFVAGKGRLPQLHHLTKKGALFLADYERVELERIPYPIGSAQFSRDYFHRVEFVSLHIALRQYAGATGQEVAFFDAYFDTQGNQRQRNSQLIRGTQLQLEGKSIVPDGNFLLKMSDGQARLFSLELHRGSDTQRIIEQLENHARIIQQDLLQKKYSHPFSNYVLSVYENPEILRAVQARHNKSPLLSQYLKHFALNTTVEINKGFLKGWEYLNKENFNIFYLK